MSGYERKSKLERKRKKDIVGKEENFLTKCVVLWGAREQCEVEV